MITSKRSGAALAIGIILMVVCGLLMAQSKKSTSPAVADKPALWSDTTYVEATGASYPAKVWWVSSKPFFVNGKKYWAVNVNAWKAEDGTVVQYGDKPYDPVTKQTYNSPGPPY